MEFRQFEFVAGLYLLMNILLSVILEHFLDPYFFPIVIIGSCLIVVIECDYVALLILGWVILHDLE